MVARNYVLRLRYEQKPQAPGQPEYLLPGQNVSSATLGATERSQFLTKLTRSMMIILRTIDKVVVSG